MVEAPARALRILLFGCAFSVVNIGFLTALFAVHGEAGAAWATMGYALVLVAGGLMTLRTGGWSQLLLLVWLLGLVNHVAVTILLGGYAHSGATCSGASATPSS